MSDALKIAGRIFPIRRTRTHGLVKTVKTFPFEFVNKYRTLKLTT